MFESLFQLIAALTQSGKTQKSPYLRAFLFTDFVTQRHKRTGFAPFLPLLAFDWTRTNK